MKISGNMKVNSRATLICWAIRSSADLLNLACSLASRVKALTTLMPARFSCRMVLSIDSFCCTLMKSGWAM